MPQSLEEWYRSTPVVTRTYLTLAFLITAACALDVRARTITETDVEKNPLLRRVTSSSFRQLISPFTVYFNSRLIYSKLQLWRLFTNFLFFGNLGLDFLFHMFFLARYCRLLEEGAFRGRTADFLYMLLVGAALLTCVAPFVHIQFLGSSLAFMLVYVWGRRNAQVNMSFLGLFNFSAPYLPWVLLAFSYVLGSSPLVDILGIGAGHTYYYLADVYPRLSGRHPLATPRLLRWLLGEHLPPAPQPAAADAARQEAAGGVERLAGLARAGVVDEERDRAARLRRFEAAAPGAGHVHDGNGEAVRGGAEARDE